MTKYYLLKDYGSDGYSLEEYESLEEAAAEIELSIPEKPVAAPKPEPVEVAALPLLNTLTSPAEPHKVLASEFHEYDGRVISGRAER